MTLIMLLSTADGTGLIAILQGVALSVIGYFLHEFRTDFRRAARELGEMQRLQEGRKYQISSMEAEIIRLQERVKELEKKCSRL